VRCNPTPSDAVQFEVTAIQIADILPLTRQELTPGTQSLYNQASILALIALSKGLRTHAMFLIEYTEDELLQIDFRMQ
jgi:hypothetical protein